MWRFDKGGLVIYIQDGGFIHRKRIEKKIDAFNFGKIGARDLSTY